MNEAETTIIHCPEGKQVYFASDFHLGAPDHKTSLERERKLILWLNETEQNAAHIFLVGDLFDFWFEYKKVIPKGYTRLLGKLADLSDKGIGISVFTGNHDMWMNGYFEQELNIPVYTKPHIFSIYGKKFFIAHGDGLGPGDHRYKLLKKVLQNRFTRWLFGIIHPSWGIALANTFSRSSRIMTSKQTFLGEDKEWLVQFSKDQLKFQDIDYFVFGHRHLPLDIRLSEKSRYINLGDWLHHYSYAVFDGEEMHLKYYRTEAKGPKLKA